VAPDQSPVSVEAHLVVPGALIEFAAYGGAGNVPGFRANSADGDSNFFVSFDTPPPNGISNITAPIGSLVGVFLPDAASPMPLPANQAMDYRDAYERNARSQSPKLGQVFLIGDGRADSGGPIVFRVPACAQRLYLGVMDAFEWRNNAGGISVIVMSDEIRRDPQGAACN
jgi:hypothetical protein